MFDKSKPQDGQSVTVLALHLDDAADEVLRRVVTSLPGFEFGGTLQQYFGEKDASLVRTLREIRPDVCIIDLDRDHQLAMETVEYLHRSASAPVTIFAVSSRMDPNSIIEAMRSGCTEYLSKPLSADKLQEALVQLVVKKRESLAPPSQGKVVTLMGVKGGVGTTTIAVHLAYFLAKSGKKVLLVDHHPELGEITLHLGLDPHNYGFYELVCNLNRMDAELLQGFVLKHESGLEVLASPEGFGISPKTTPEGIQQTLRFLLRMYDYVVIDTDCRFDEQNLCILELSDEFCLVTAAQLPAVRSTSRFLDYLLRLNVASSKVHVILNRSARNNPISIDHVEKVLRRKLSLVIPNAESEVSEAIGTGVPIGVKSRSEFMQSLTKWARRFLGTPDSKSDTEPERSARGARSRFNVLGISG